MQPDPPLTQQCHPGSNGQLLFLGAILTALVLIQALFVAVTLPIESLFRDDMPVFSVDHAYHWYQVRIAEDLLSQGLLVGYEPRFAAGYLGGVPFNPSGKVPALTTFLLSGWLSQEACYKFYLFAASVIAALCVPLAAFWMRCPRPVVMIAAILGLCLWWASAFRWFYTVGLVSFVLSAYLALPFYARLRLLMESKFSPGAATLLGGVGALCFLLHPLFPLIVLLLLLPDVVLRWSSIATRSALGNAALVATVSLVPNLLWLLPTFTLPRLNDGTDPYQKAVDVTKIYREALGIWQGSSMGAKINPVLIALSIFGSRGQRTTDTGANALILSWGIATLFANLGGAIPAFAQLQPNRFSPVAYLFLAIPSACGTLFLAERIRDHATSKPSRVFFAAVLVTALGLTAFVANEVRREVSSNPVGHYGQIPPESRSVGKISQWILGILQEQTDESGRVLFETSAGRVHDGAHMAGYYALQSSREFIGGPYPYVLFASFWDGWVFGKPIGEHSRETFLRYLEIYNVHWVIVHSEKSKAYMRALPGLELVDSRFGIDMFRLKTTSTFFLEGSGRIVEHGTNRLVLSDLSAGEVLIKYHFVPGVSTLPPVVIEPVLLDGDPQPFIRIKNGSSKRIQISWSPPH